MQLQTVIRIKSTTQVQTLVQAVRLVKLFKTINVQAARLVK
jgi:hypothetical protein